MPTMPGARWKLEAIQRCDDPRTIADGLRTTSIGERNFAVISRHVSQIVPVTEAEILDAMRFVWERVKIVIEPSAAVAVAPLVNRLRSEPGGIGVILSGGNVDLDAVFPGARGKTRVNPV